MARPTLPAQAVHARTTPEFTDESVPAALLGQHRIAANTWGRLRVRAGSVRLVFDDDGGQGVEVAAGAYADIPPEMTHHVVPGSGARFVVEFFRLGPR